MTPAPELALKREMYRRMVLIRRFEECVRGLFARGQIPGAVHLSIGQEAEVVGACMALRADDYMVGNHRSHGHPIGKGAALNPLMAEILGKATGINGGKGGSMHLADFSVGSLGESSIVGSGIPVAVGAALGAKMQRSGRVALGFFGDGAANQGYFHEALNMAALWRLPVVLVCENNRYGVTTPLSRAAAVEDIAARAPGYGIPGVIVDGQDALAVYEVTAAAVARARAGDGPTLIEAKTYRYHHHSEGPLYDHIAYRDAQELDEWQARDPLRLLRARLLEDSAVPAGDLDALEAAAAAEVDEALRFAQASPWPEAVQARRGLYRTAVPDADAGHA